MLNQNIKDFRKKKGYTQETLAQELNVVRQTVSKWEKGYSVPDAVMLEKIADLLEVSVSDLLGDSIDVSEDTPDITQISDQLSILNNIVAKELSRRKRNRRIIIIVLIVLALLIGAIFLIPQKTYDEEIIDDSQYILNITVDKNLDKAVSAAILSIHGDPYVNGECATEGHLIYDVSEKDNLTTVYLLEDYSEWGFLNGFFTTISGGRTPAAFTFKKNENKYILMKYEYAQDGGEFTNSIKKLFPKRIVSKMVYGPTSYESELLWQSQENQAKTYLKSIGREAEIHPYNSIAIERFSSFGIPAEITDCLYDIVESKGYDCYVGNHETVENEKRYVYQTGYDPTNCYITFTKFLYDTGKVVEYIVVDSTTGKVIPNVPAPETAKYVKGNILMYK